MPTRRLALAAEWPSGRIHHDAAAKGGTLLVVFGGGVCQPSCRLLSDLWLFDTVQWRWRAVAPEAGPAPRLGVVREPRSMPPATRPDHDGRRRVAQPHSRAKPMARYRHSLTPLRVPVLALLAHFTPGMNRTRAQELVALGDRDGHTLVLAVFGGESYEPHVCVVRVHTLSCN